MRDAMFFVLGVLSAPLIWVALGELLAWRARKRRYGNPPLERSRIPQVGGQDK